MKLFAAAFLGIFLFVTPESQAKKSCDPRFGFKAAKRAFAQARVPNETALAGRWAEAGWAGADGSSYFPEGKRPYGNGDFYRLSLNIQPLPSDAFGEKRFHLFMASEDVNTGRQGKPYYDEFNAWLSERSLQHVFFRRGQKLPDSQGITCESTRYCRVVEANGMLLCALIVTDRQCGDARNQFLDFRGYVRY